MQVVRPSPNAARVLERSARYETSIARQAPTRLAAAMAFAQRRSRRMKAQTRRQAGQAFQVPLPPVNCSPEPDPEPAGWRTVFTTPGASARSNPPCKPKKKWRPIREHQGTKASGLRMVTNRRAAAEIALREAAIDKDAQRLEVCIQAAREAAVNPILISDAKRVLRALHRVAAERAVCEAAEWTDAVKLETCIEKARQAGVSEALIAPAQDALQRVREESQQRMAADADVRLSKALRSRDPDYIAICIAASREAGTAQDKVKDAEQLLEQLQTERRATAESDLREAMHSKDWKRIDRQLTACRNQVPAAMLKNAEALIASLRNEERVAEEQSLKAAIEKKSNLLGSRHHNRNEILRKGLAPATSRNSTQAIHARVRQDLKTQLGKLRCHPSLHDAFAVRPYFAHVRAQTLDLVTTASSNGKLHQALRKSCQMN